MTLSSPPPTSITSRLTTIGRTLTYVPSLHCEFQAGKLTWCLNSDQSVPNCSAWPCSTHRAVGKLSRGLDIVHRYVVEKFTRLFCERGRCLVKVLLCTIVDVGRVADMKTRLFHLPCVFGRNAVLLHPTV